jgi:hypothetical protein
MWEPSVRRAPLARLLVNFFGGLALFFLVTFFTSVFGTYERKKQPKEPNLEEKIVLLTKNLNDAARAISDVEREVQTRQKLADKLRSDAEEAQTLVTLNQKQVEAVAQALRGQLEERERASYWWNLGQNFFFAALGVALSELYRWIVRKVNRRREAVVRAPTT